MREDVGISAQAFAQDAVPVLGVCLGHEVLCCTFGMTVARAPRPMHGRLSKVVLDGLDQGDGSSPSLFRGIPNMFEAVRYHSLAAYPTPGTDRSANRFGDLQVLARAEDDQVIMAVRHVSKPFWGIQFHPESVCTAHGEQLLINFRDCADAWLAGRNQSSSGPPPRKRRQLLAALQRQSHSVRAERSASFATAVEMAGTLPVPEHSPLPLSGRTLGAGDDRFRVVVSSPIALPVLAAPSSAPEVAERLYATAFPESTGRPRFWLDSATSWTDAARTGAQPSSGAWARFSIMGVSGGPHAELLRFYMDPRKRALRLGASHEENRDAGNSKLEVTTWKVGSSPATVTTLGGPSVFTALDVRIEGLRSRCDGMQVWTGATDAGAGGPLMALEDWNLPFDFACGYVGFFGYGLRKLCGVKSCGVSSYTPAAGTPRPDRDAAGPASILAYDQTPDAAFLLADRSLVIDHEERLVYVMALCSSDAASPEAQTQSSWLATTTETVRSCLGATHAPAEPATSVPTQRRDSRIELVPECSPQAYVARVAACLEHIADGNSYEVCLTNQLLPAAARDGGARTTAEPWATYTRLRRLNPAPYGAFLDLRPACPLSVCSSSPERFIKVDCRRNIDSKPIKGTVKRDPDPVRDTMLRKELAASEKDRAENLMIVDLVRNDLGRVCKPGSVHAPKLMDVESYATVHQLVSTVRGALRDEFRALDAIRAAFPGGSMTGAPKLRTMQIIDSLETQERGVYSGSLGYLSLNGAADLSIVIRTIVFDDERGVSVGAGGAVVALSDPQAEYEEMLLKSQAVTRCL